MICVVTKTGIYKYRIFMKAFFIRNVDSISMCVQALFVYINGYKIAIFEMPDNLAKLYIFD